VAYNSQLANPQFYHTRLKYVYMNWKFQNCYPKIKHLRILYTYRCIFGNGQYRMYIERGLLFATNGSTAETRTERQDLRSFIFWWRHTALRSVFRYTWLLGICIFQSDGMFLSHWVRKLPLAGHGIRICDGQSHTGAGFSASTSVLPCRHNSFNVSYPFVHLSPTQYNLRNGWCHSITHLLKGQVIWWRKDPMPLIPNCRDRSPCGVV
jgi:hypothetical protein